MTDAPEASEPITPVVAEAAKAAHRTNPWRLRDFRLLWVGRIAAVLAIQIQSSALLWQVYEIARRDHPIAEASLYLGLVGLAQFISLLVLTLPAGEMADRRDRKLTVALSITVEGLCAIAFLAMALHGSPPLWGLLAVAYLFGACRAFLAPASQAFLPMVVGRAALPRAIAAQSIAFQTGAIAGPALGGVIVGLLRASFGAGAFAMALYLARFPIMRHGGKRMFASVAVFGCCTLAFGLSKVVWISVNIRQTLIQLSTPDHMRGRVSPVSMLFIGASNELGKAYSGLVLRCRGPIGTAAFGGLGGLGGLGALAATGIWARLFPDLRKADKLG